MKNKTLTKNMPNVKWQAIPPVRGPNPQGITRSKNGKKIIAKLKNLISKVFGKRCECKEEELDTNERIKRKIAAGHTNVSK